MDNNELYSKMMELFDLQTVSLKSYIDEKVSAVELKIENDVSRRLDALSDGYKLTHEKQWEQERKIESMQEQIEALKLQILAINKKLA